MKLAFARAGGADGFYPQVSRSSAIELHWFSPRPVTAMAIVLALLAVVGSSSRRPVSGGSAVPTVAAWPLLVLVGTGSVLSLAILFAALWPPPRLRAGPDEPPLIGVPIRPGPLVAATAVLLALTLVAIVVATDPSGRQRAAPPRGSPASDASRSRPPDRLRSGGANGVAAVAVGLAAGALGITALVIAGRARRPRDVPNRAREHLAAATEDALGVVMVDDDPRAAVLAAYARMETALGRVGLGRRPSDAPREYLARLELALGAAGAPAAALTALFERARFSTQPVDDGLRDDAREALRRLGRELDRTSPGGGSAARDG